MTDALFQNILRHLSRIDYRRSVHINRFNEPLADRDYALARIRTIRAVLPHSPIAVFTNGDYLDADYVHELRDAGVTSMLATVHEAPGGTAISDLLDDQDRRLARLGLPFTYLTTPAGNLRDAVVDGGEGLIFHYIAQDFHRRDANGVLWMENRTHDPGIERGVVRTTPCFIPFTQMSIEWDGELLPCCQIQPDMFPKHQYSLGVLSETDDPCVVWTNARYVQWRKDLFSYEVKKKPCSTCTYGGMVNDLPQMRWIVEQWRRTLSMDVTPAPVAAFD